MPLLIGAIGDDVTGSTEHDNTGPVAEALLERLGVEITIYCSAFPENGRTVYNGHLFVGRDRLSDSGMRHHPLTPMTDVNLVRVLGRQVRSPETVGLIGYATVDLGAAALPKLDGGCAVLAGSCSTATRRQAALQLRALRIGPEIAPGVP